MAIHIVIRNDLSFTNVHTYTMFESLSAMNCQVSIAIFFNGFYETYELPEGITAKNFNIANLYCYTTKFDENIDVESFTEDGMQTGELYYISDKELRELCKDEIDLVKKSIEDYTDDSFDNYDQADLLAALLNGGSEKAAEHALSYNGDAECSDREIKGYLFHKDFKSVTLL